MIREKMKPKIKEQKPEEQKPEEQKQEKSEKEMKHRFKERLSVSAKLGIAANVILVLFVCLIAFGIYSSGFKARPKRYNPSDYISDVSIDGWTYGEAANMPVASGNFSEVAYTYEGIKGTEYKRTANVPKNAGTYEVAAEIPGAPKDTPGTKATTELKINRAKVTLPEIEPKAYNGTHQVASIPDSDAWTVESNQGGVEKGSYDVILKPTGNYRWNMSDEKKATEPVILEFDITGEEEVEQNRIEKASKQADAAAAYAGEGSKQRESDPGADDETMEETRGASDGTGQSGEKDVQEEASQAEESRKTPDMYQLSKRWKNTDNGWTVDPEDGSWYFILDHKAKTNWYCDPEDGHWYYFDPLTAKMKIGWQKIGADYYYFSEDDTDQTWFMKADGMWHFDTRTRGTNRPYGSMYCNEYTPDGSFVNQVGAKVQ